MPNYITDDSILSQLNGSGSSAQAPAAPAPAQSPLDRALQAEGVDGPLADIARSVYRQESASGTNTRTSNAGAVGGMQVMPTTFKDVADPGWDINNPDHNAQAGVRYLKTLYDASGGNPTLTAAGYYGGPGAMLKAAQGIPVSDPRNPKAPNTLQYADQVTSRLPAQSTDQSTAAAPATAVAPTAPGKQYVQDPALLASLNAPGPKDASFLSNLGSGLQKGATDIKAGIQERIRDGLEALGAKDTADSMGLATPEFVAQKRQDDAPLMATAGGKIGNFVAKAAPAALSMFVPGGQGVVPAIAMGATEGFLQPTTKDESVARNTIAGAAGGTIGYGVAKGIGAAANSVLQSATTKAAQNASKDTIAEAARDAGYVIPPTQTNPTVLNSVLEGFSGKLSTAQKASGKNQSVTNNLAAQELGLPTDQPLSQAALAGVRQRAGAAYDAVANTGTVTPTAAYDQALDKITAPYLKAAQGFPNAPVNPVVASIDALRSSQFDAGSAVAKVSELREAADAAFRAGDKATGKALKSGANALEDALDTHLQNIGAPANLLQDFRNARAQIAKSYTVGSALNDSTGNVNAVKIASKLTKAQQTGGTSPLSGNLRTIAETAQAFPKATQEITSSAPGVSPLDFFGSNLLHAAGGGLASIATLGARPLTRAAILSKPYQATLGVPSYGGSRVLNALGSAPGQALLRSAIPAAAVSEAQGYANGGRIGDVAGQAAGDEALQRDQAVQQNARSQEGIGLKALGYSDDDLTAMGYANGGVVGKRRRPQRIADVARA